MVEPQSPPGPCHDLGSEDAEGHPLRHVRFVGWPTTTQTRPRRYPGHAGSREEAHDTLDGLARHVLTRSGLDPEDYRIRPLNRRVPACLRALGVRTTSQAIDKLAEHPALLHCALDALLIGVGEFFRDGDVMAALARHLPELARQRDGELRVWSAACGNGSELYSLAIVLAEAGLLAGSTLLGTDCRASAIATANRGVYREDAIRKLRDSLRDRYLVPCCDEWRVALPALCRISWQRCDALRASAEGLWDVILCRNMAIYLRCEAGHALWATLASRLRSGGLLVVGNAERPSAAGLELLERCVYRKDGGSHV